MNAAYIISLWIHNYMRWKANGSLAVLTEELHTATAKNYQHWVNFYLCLLWELERR